MSTKTEAIDNENAPHVDLKVHFTSVTVRLSRFLYTTVETLSSVCMNLCDVCLSCMTW